MTKTRRGTLRLALLGGILIAGLGLGCSGGFESEVITAENQEQLLETAKATLSYEDFEALHAYLQRTYPDLPEGQLPAGRTIRQMIDEQKAFQSSVAAAEPTERLGSGDQAEPTGEGGSGDQAEGSQAMMQSAQSLAPGGTATGDASSATPGKIPAPDSEPVKRAPVKTAPPPPPPPTTAVVPSGTELPIRLTQSLSSKTNQSGQKFEAELNRDLVIDGKVVAPEGSIVIGKLTNVAAAGKVKGRARMSLTLSEIRVKGESYPIKTNTFSYEAKGTTKKDATKVGVASGVGALVGAIAGGGKGAAIGAGVGAGAGTGVVLATSGDEVEFGVEKLFRFKLRNPVEMKIITQ